MEDKAAPGVIRRARQQIREQAGVPWISIGWKVYLKTIRWLAMHPSYGDRPDRPRWELGRMLDF